MWIETHNLTHKNTGKWFVSIDFFYDSIMIVHYMRPSFAPPFG